MRRLSFVLALATAAALNVILFGGRLNGIIPPRTMLFAADLYWLNLYVSAIWLLRAQAVREPRVVVGVTL